MNKKVSILIGIALLLVGIVLLFSSLSGMTGYASLDDGEEVDSVFGIFGVYIIGIIFVIGGILFEASGRKKEAFG